MNVDLEEKKGRPSVFGVFCRHKSGLVSLRALCTNEQKAEQYRYMLQENPFETPTTVVLAWIEHMQLDHLYGGEFALA